jgi:hypothetical protein
MKTITNIIYSTFAVFALACSALAQQAPDRVSIRVITTFDYPGTVISTGPQKINDRGDIVGFYIDSSFVVRGFVRFANGSFSAPIVDPNDTCNTTLARGINNSRLICGSYASGADCTNSTLHGFFLMSGNFSDFDVPGFVNTEVAGVNNVGDFAGTTSDATGSGPGFVSIGGIITTFSVPGATDAIAYQLNSSNQTEGYYIDGSGIFHGYWRDSDGTLHFPIDPPGSVETELFGNNDSNWMVGRYRDSGGTTHGLFFVSPNRFLTFDYPGSTFTSFNGINARGFICGRYLDASGIEHGIIARVRGVPAGDETGTEMKVYDFPSQVTPVNPPSLVRPVNPSASAW